jgi:hypothetical protein
MSKRPATKVQRQLRLKRGSASPPVFENRLPMRRIYFGSIDATDEIDTGGDESIEDFYSTFHLPAGLDLDGYRRGRDFLVYGLKGTGKTSFLRYFGEYLRRGDLGHFELFRFARDFPQEIYDDVRRVYLSDPDEEIPRDKIFLQLDYEDVWIYIILRRISERVPDFPGLFEPNEDLSRFQRFLDAIRRDDVRNKVLKFLPNIQQGEIHLVEGYEDDQVDALFSDPADRRLTFHDFVGHAVKLYGRLKPGATRFYILFDEIEPRVASGPLFETDCILVRDLVLSLRKLNTVHRPETKNVFLIAAVRSEILSRVKQLGKEIHKHFEQFGFCMNWGDQGRSNVAHPLIRMVCEKIAYSERRAGLLTAEIGAIEEYIWPRYFRSNRTEQLDPKVLLDQTWYRPRDLVRIFKIVTQIAGNAEGFTESLLSQVRKRYAEQSWEEIQSQLTVEFDPGEISGLESVLTAFKPEFTLDEFEQRISSLAGVNNAVARLKRKHETTEIVSALYQIGVIGDISAGHRRYKFRGDADPNFLGRFGIHRGLLARFNLRKGPRQAGWPPRDSGGSSRGRTF